MRRFYASVAVVASPAGGFAVELDGRPLRTPGQAPLAVSSRPLADAIADEWRGQGDIIRPDAMPLTRLANTAIDRLPDLRAQVIAELVKYAGTDLLCYRADAPADLAARQAALWQPLLDWAAVRFDAALAVTGGVAPVAQPPESLAALRRAVAPMDDYQLCALEAITVACGSLVLALALAEGRLSAEEAFAAAQVDETWQNERWGVDPEAEARYRWVKADLLAAARFLALYGQGG